MLGDIDDKYSHSFAHFVSKCLEFCEILNFFCSFHQASLGMVGEDDKNTVVEDGWYMYLYYGKKVTKNSLAKFLILTP